MNMPHHNNKIITFFFAALNLYCNRDLDTWSKVDNSSICMCVVCKHTIDWAEKIQEKNKQYFVNDECTVKLKSHV